MFKQTDSSLTTQKLQTVLTRFTGSPFIDAAVLATSDGLPIVHSLPISTQLAAVAGFLLAAVRQSWAMLELPSATEMTFTVEHQNQTQNGRCLICHAFTHREVHLILAFIIEPSVSYQPLIQETIVQIQAIITETMPH